MRCDLVYQTPELISIKSVKRIPDFKSVKLAEDFLRMEHTGGCVSKAWIEGKNLNKIKDLKGGL